MLDESPVPGPALSSGVSSVGRVDAHAKTTMGSPSVAAYVHLETKSVAAHLRSLMNALGVPQKYAGEALQSIVKLRTTREPS